jgi:hypothetical protein
MTAHIPKKCADCPAEIGQSATRCKSCAATHKYRDPAAREKMRQAKRRSLAERPEQLAHLRAVGAGTFHKMHEKMRERGYRGNAKYVPAHRLGEYDKLRKKLGAADALSIILDDERAQARRALAAIGKQEVSARAPLTFEEQLARVAAGAKLVPVFKPRRPEPEFTLGGIATGMI